jgi:hypothetical protein
MKSYYTLLGSMVGSYDMLVNSFVCTDVSLSFCLIIIAKVVLYFFLSYFIQYFYYSFLV